MTKETVRQKTNYWIMKSEPDEFSIDDLQKKGISIWDGIRNYQVRNMIRNEIKVGDIALFYHSSAKDIGVAGVMRVVKAGYIDPTQFDKNSNYYDPKSKKESPRWLSFDVEFDTKFNKLISLSKIKQNPKLQNMVLVKRGNRLSISKIEKEEFYEISKMAQI